MTELQARLYNLILDIFQHKDKSGMHYGKLPDADARGYAGRLAVAAALEAYKYFTELEKKSAQPSQDPVVESPLTDQQPEHVTEALAALDRLAHAAGKNYARQPHTCPVCSGKGYKMPKARYGRGKRDRVTCVACDGKGIVWDPRSS